MRGAILYGPHDIRFDERATPNIIEPTDAIIGLSMTSICGGAVGKPLARPNQVSKGTDEDIKVGEIELTATLNNSEA